MMRKLRTGTIHQWFAGFVEALEDAHAAQDATSLSSAATGVKPLRTPTGALLH
jgi:trehalose 6-phosphate synthase